jgi:serine/threonine protein kinase
MLVWYGLYTNIQQVGSEEQLLLVRKRLMARHVLLERLRVEGLSHVPSHAFTLRKDFRSFLEILLAHYLLEEQSSREISSTTRRSFFGQRTARRHHEEGALWMWELLNAFDTLWTNKHQCRNKHRTRTLLTWSVIRSSPLVPCEHFSVCDVPMYSEEVSTPLFINYFEDPWTSCNIGHKSLIKACNRERLADGGFATVYRITLPATSMTSATSGARQYALKEISRKTTPFRRWRNEEKILKLLGKVKNPHIINLVCSDYTPEDYLLLFPLADCDLDQLMEHDLPASPSLSTWVLKQVLGITEALECIHAGDSTTRAYVSHGDLKPDNILWLPQDTGTKARVDPTKGRLVIADFGLAQIHSTTTKECPLAKASNCNLTRERTQPDRQYAAPEVELATSSEADYRASDVFSLGCVLLELLVWLLEGPRGRRVLRESLCSDAPGDATSFWRVEMTTNSLTFSLKSQVQACLELLLERKHSNATLQTAIDFMVYGSPLDPNPTSRPTAAEVRSLLSVIESGKLHKPLSIRREEPVWARTWVATPSQSQRRGSLAADEETSSDDASKKSYTSSTLDMHVEARPQLCGIDREHANLAVKNAHFKQKCPFCNSEGRPVALKYHIRAQHRTRQPYRCSSCEWLFGSKGQLVRHRRSFESCTPTRWLAMPNVVHKYRRSFLQTVNTKGRTLKRARESDDAEESLEPDGKRSRQAKKRKLAPVNDFPSMRSGGVKRYPKDDDWSGGPSSSNVC